ncbi:MAG: enoyl-CoA hydratase/isomerase family protein [Acidimicrobiaceae bacterium]|nr:enoyl-CoA hydratase/isomerase family protein [Acidimicrobiaceae bacterium]
MSDSEKFVTYEVDSNDIAVIRLDRPKANAISKALLRQLGDVADQLLISPPHAVLIHGGERIFAAGADITEFAGIKEAIETAGIFHEVLNKIARIPRVTIASINGFALGGGCELAMACDFRVAATDSRLGQPEVLLGLIPGGGGTQRLPRLVGVAKAKDLIYSGRAVSANEALEIGLVDRVCDPDKVFSEAYAWALSFAKGAVVAQGLSKKAIDLGLAGTLSHGLDVERLVFSEVFGTKDAEIGVTSFLTNGPGKAVFLGE